jgi:lysophospholipase L1-like esterase
MKNPIHHIVILGDSTTFGFNDHSGLGGWAGRLKVWFEKTNRADYGAVFNLGISGATSEHLRDRAPVELKHRKPDLVIIDIGANDAAHFKRANAGHRVEPKKFSRNLKFLVSTSRKYTSKIVLLTPVPCVESKTTPVSWAKVYYTNADLKKYAELTKAVARREHVKVLDLFEMWQGAKFARYLPDGVHPSTKGHELLYGQIRAFVQKTYL